MRQNIRDFLATIASNLDLPEPIVEIGALQVPGQEGFADLRPLLPGKAYLGCDMREGPGVDQVEDVEVGLSFPDASVGTLLSFDTIEHVFDVFRAFSEFRRVLQPGGVLVVSSVMLFPIHSHPYDYWRFTPECLSRLLAGFDRHLAFAEGEPDLPHTVYGVASRAPVPVGFDAMGVRALDFVRHNPQDGRGCVWQPSLPWPGGGGPASMADIRRLEGSIVSMSKLLLALTEALRGDSPATR